MTVKPWKTLSRIMAFGERNVRVARDTVELPDGEVTDYLVLLGGEGVSVLAIDGEGAYFVRQYRHPIGQLSLELPGGGTNRGESPQEAARRELREEAGLEVGTLSLLGSFYPSASRATTIVHVFVGQVVGHCDLSPDAGEHLDVERIPLRVALQMVDSGEIREVTTAYALLKWDREEKGRG